MSEFTKRRAFDRVSQRRRMPEPMPFPERGLAETEVLARLVKKLSRNIPSERNFANSYAGPAHPFANKAYELGSGSLFVSGWGDEIYAGTGEMEKEAVRMVSSLLGLNDSNSVGFITSGGTESNILAVRMAKLLSKKARPEIVVPGSGHFSFDLAGTLLGVKVNHTRLNDDFTPEMGDVKKLINENTVALVCSAPEGTLGVMDPMAEFAELAESRGLYLHVDSAFGGFILPFMKEMGYRVPAFDFTLRSVSSMITDSHKIGLVPIAASFLIFRDSSYTDAIPTDETLIHTLTSTKNGGLAAAAWALFQHLGKEGYRKYVANLLEVTHIIAQGASEIKGLRLVCKPYISIIGITAEPGISVRKVHRGLLRRGWGAGLEKTPGTRGFDFIRLSLSPMRDNIYANGFLSALRDSVREAK